MSSHDLIVALLAVCVCCGVALIVKAIRAAVAKPKSATLGVNSDGTRPSTMVGHEVVYDRAFVYINGKLLGQAESANLDIECKRDETGKMLGKTLRARVVSLVPLSGFEFDGFRFANGGDPVELRLRFGGSGRTLKSNGCIVYASLVNSAKEPSRLEFEFSGEPAEFDNHVASPQRRLFAEEKPSTEAP